MNEQTHEKGQETFTKMKFHLTRKVNCIRFSPRVKLLPSKQKLHGNFAAILNKFFKHFKKIFVNMLSRSIKQFSPCISTIKSVIYFMIEVKEVLENLNESRRVPSRSPKL